MNNNLHQENKHKNFPFPLFERERKRSQLCMPSCVGMKHANSTGSNTRTVGRGISQSNVDQPAWPLGQCPLHEDNPNLSFSTVYKRRAKYSV